MSRPVRSGLVALLVAAACLAPPGGPGAAASVDADDPFFVGGLQWGLERIGAPQAWPRATGTGTVIAIVDSGADLGHEDLRERIHSTASCLGASGDPARCSTGSSAQDDNGHGTHVAGIAAAHTGNSRGIAGVAPGARLMIVRVLRNECSNPANPSTCTATGTASDVAAGIRWAADNGAHVINLSLGGGVVQSVAGCAFCDAVEYAWERGAIPVVAAGNDAVLPSGFGREHAVVVTATTRDDAAAPYSNTSSGLLRDARWPVAAPGGQGDSGDSCRPGGQPRGILSTYLDASQPSSYACLAGTSMAAPHVSGALAVLRGQGRTPQESVDRLIATADDLGPPGRDDTYGYGRINLARAVGTAPSPTTEAPPPPAPDSQATTPAPPPQGAAEQPVAPPATSPPAPAPQPTAAPEAGDDEPELPEQATSPEPDPEELAARSPTARSEPDSGHDSVPVALAALAALLVVGSGLATTWWSTRPAPRTGRR